MLPILLDKRYIRVHFDECGRYYIVTVIAFLLGLAAGFFTKVNVATVNANTYVLLTFSKVFFSAFFQLLLTLAAVVFCCLFYYCSPLAVIIIILRGITIARHFVIIGTIFGTSGVFFVCFFYAPFHIIFSLIIIVSCTTCLRRCFCNRFTRRLWTNHLRESCIFFAAAALALLVLCAIFSGVYVKLVVLL